MRENVGSSWPFHRRSRVEDAAGENIPAIKGFLNEHRESVPGTSAKLWQKPSRKEADGIMLEGMAVLKVPAWHKYSIYIAVRVFGWLAWKRNQWDREAGFRRVLINCRLKTGYRLNCPGLILRTLHHIQNRYS